VCHGSRSKKRIIELVKDSIVSVITGAGDIVNAAVDTVSE